MILFENGSDSFAKFKYLCKYTRWLSRVNSRETKDGCGLVKEVLQYYKQQHSLHKWNGANDYWNLKGLNGHL
jgi:hypothetical protein